MKTTPRRFPFVVALILSLILHAALLSGLPQTREWHLERAGTSLEILFIPRAGTTPGPSSTPKPSGSPSRPYPESSSRSPSPAPPRLAYRSPSPSPPKKPRPRRKSPVSEKSHSKRNPIPVKTPGAAKTTPVKKTPSKKFSLAASSEKVSPRGISPDAGRNVTQSSIASPPKNPRRGSSPGHDAETSYLSLLLARISSHRYYPRLARLRGYEGRVLLAITIGASGELVDLRILKGSGHRVLDRAALLMVRRAAPFPAPPPGLGPFPREFTIPVRFELTSR